MPGIKRFADEAFEAKGPTFRQLKTVLSDYVDKNPDSVYDMGLVLAEEDPDEIMDLAYRLLEDNDRDLEDFVAGANGLDLEDANDVGELMFHFSEAVLECIERPLRLARRKATAANLKASGGDIRQGRPYGPDRKPD